MTIDRAQGREWGGGDKHLSTLWREGEGGHRTQGGVDVSSTNRDGCEADTSLYIPTTWPERFINLTYLVIFSEPRREWCSAVPPPIGRPSIGLQSREELTASRNNEKCFSSAMQLQLRTGPSAAMIALGYLTDLILLP